MSVQCWNSWNRNWRKSSTAFLEIWTADQATSNDTSSAAHPTPIVSPSPAARINPNKSSSLAICMTLNVTGSKTHPAPIISLRPAARVNPCELSSSASRTTQNMSSSPETYPVSSMSGSSKKSIFKLPDPFVRSGKHLAYKKKITAGWYPKSYKKVKEE